MESEIEDMVGRINLLKDEFAKEQKRFSKLSIDYEEAKCLNPVQRYAELKKIIKETIPNITE